MSSDTEVLAQLHSSALPVHKLESVVGPERSVKLRREFLLGERAQGIPSEGYDYTIASVSCCENIVGYIPIPLGVAGPLIINDIQYTVPMATTEGCLVASLSRGCRAIRESGSIESSYTNCGMTRAPLLKFPSAKLAREAVDWITPNYSSLQTSFNSTSRYARLVSIAPKQAGNLLFLRVTATTGDAMGMNMISKGCEEMLKVLCDQFSTMRVLSVSGNYCVDKKASAINWINNRGYSVCCDIVLKKQAVEAVLKTTAQAMVELNISKNLVGSSLAGCIGGNNAHAANIVTAIYLATGQDVAQSGTSSMSLVTMEECGEGDLYVSVTMPCIEVGTVGGGTVLTAQQSCIQLVSGEGRPPAHLLAQVVCGAVLAGEVSLLAALTSGDLVKSHMKHNRS